MPLGAIINYRSYDVPRDIAEGNIGTTYTPWLGLLDPLLSRILEEFCREGLEFVTTKRDMWRARAEGDIVALLGIRHLDEVDSPPSMWKGFPV